MFHVDYHTNGKVVETWITWFVVMQHLGKFISFEIKAISKEAATAQAISEHPNFEYVDTASSGAWALIKKTLSKHLN
jgi:hypothetical protein